MEVHIPQGKGDGSPGRQGWTRGVGGGQGAGVRVVRVLTRVEGWERLDGWGGWEGKVEGRRE